MLRAFDPLITGTILVLVRASASVSVSFRDAVGTRDARRRRVSRRPMSDVQPAVCLPQGTGSGLDTGSRLEPRFGVEHQIC